MSEQGVHRQKICPHGDFVPCPQCVAALEATVAALQQQVRDAEAKASLADELADAAREWLRAKKFRENMPVPFGATPLTHPEVFGNALGMAKEGNRLLQEALGHYDALTSPDTGSEEGT